MKITVEMACSINGLIATKEGNEDFLSNRNYQIMLEFLKEYNCLVWGNTTFKNVISWGDNYIDDLKDATIIIFSKEKQVSNYKNVIYCNSMKNFLEICKEKNIKNVFVSGGAHINNLFLENNMVDEIIINYNPYVLTNGINLFKGNDVEKSLVLNKVIREKEDIIQIWYKVKK